MLVGRLRRDFRLYRDPRATFYYPEEMKSFRRFAFSLGFVAGACAVSVFVAALGLFS
jgi:hypothetical protein